MKAPSDLENLILNEIFYTIQGEGINTGKPSIFIRLAKCNLQCIWCDTKYTWLYNEKSLIKLKTIAKEKSLFIHDLKIYHKKIEAVKTSIDDIIAEIRSYNCTHLVITGGEPLLQKASIIKLLEKLPNYSIEIETNGTISPQGMPSYVRFNVSPKLSNSFNSSKLRYKPKILKEFSTLTSSLKYVISRESDITEVLDQLSELAPIQIKVILMPEATSEGELKLKQKWLIELCKKHNFFYGNRLHVQIFGAKRGV